MLKGVPEVSLIAKLPTFASTTLTKILDFIEFCKLERYLIASLYKGNPES